MIEEVNPWHLTKRHIFTGSSMFKICKISSNSFITHMPELSTVNFYDFHFKDTRTSIKFSHRLQAIEYYSLGQQNYVIAGLKNGIIEAIKDGGSENCQQKFTLEIEDQKINNNYINDILSLKNGRLMNSYNTGKCAIWDVNSSQSQKQPISHFEVHQKYFYKIRKLEEEKVVTCGQDKYANIVDIDSEEIIQSFYHSGSVWCSYPINNNVICSGGLMDSLNFWDVRSDSLLHVTSTQNHETSFITHLNPHQIVFGDGPKIKKCDLRKPIAQSLCEMGMRQSAQAILVIENGAIVVGRGSDMCLFSSQNEEYEQKVIGSANNSFYNYLNWILNRRNAANEENNEQEQDEDQFIEDDQEQQH